MKIVYKFHMLPFLLVILTLVLVIGFEPSFGESSELSTVVFTVQ